MWREYSERKQTYAQLAERYGCSSRTIKRKLDAYTPPQGISSPGKVTVLMDTTYWGRKYGVMLFKDELTDRDLLWCFVKELKRIVDMLTETDRESFEGMFWDWCEKWNDYLQERATDPETGISHYTHKKLRSAYLSVRRNLPLLFTWYGNIEMGIPNTTNRIDGHFPQLKRMLRNHNGMKRKRRDKLVVGFFEASKGKSR